MPKQKGLILLKGTLNGICYYKLNGVHISRKASGPSKETINSNPSFARVKANTKEFGGGSKLSKAICDGLQNNLKTFKDSYMTSRLSGVCRKIIQEGSGTHGQREANLFNKPSALIGFQMNKTKVFSQIYTAKTTVVVNQTRTHIQINIPNSANYNIKQKPKTATHFMLTAAISMVSNYQWHQESDAYVPEDIQNNAIGNSTTATVLDCKTQHQNITISIQNPIQTTVPNNVAITVWLGITYGNLQANEFYPMQTSKAMQCIAIV